jgi:sortase A
VGTGPYSWSPHRKAWTTAANVTLPASPIAGPSSRARTPRPGRFLRAFGVLCLLAASGVAGYLTWVLWGTGLETAREQNALRETFERQLNAVPSPTTSNANDEPILPGRAYAQIEIPDIGLNFIVVQGTTTQDLKKGPGHYADTADPWQETGRVGIAGHRTTYLHPFQQLDELDRGDEILLSTRNGTFDYSVARVFVIPAEGSGRVLEQTEKPSLVLTTCHPEFSATDRLIVYADLTG